MKTLLTLLTCLFLLSPTVVLSKTVKYEDLVKTKGLYYQKSSDVPFTGTSTGKEQGKIKKGKIEGPWVEYHDNGYLGEKGNYKDGEYDGPWVSFKSDGTVNKKWTGTYKNGKKISD